jgi:hypothetical protein
VAPIRLLIDPEKSTLAFPQCEEGAETRETIHARALANHNKAKENMRRSDSSKASDRNLLQVGETVLILNSNRKKKSDAIYLKETFKVIEVKGDMVTAENEIQSITRNYSFFKKFDSVKEQIKPKAKSSAPVSKENALKQQEQQFETSLCIFEQNSDSDKEQTESDDDLIDLDLNISGETNKTDALLDSVNPIDTVNPIDIVNTSIEQEENTQQKQALDPDLLATQLTPLNITETETVTLAKDDSHLNVQSSDSATNDVSLSPERSAHTSLNETIIDIDALIANSTDHNTGEDVDQTIEQRDKRVLRNKTPVDYTPFYYIYDIQK